MNMSVYIESMYDIKRVCYTSYQAETYLY
jgi:hypothetical protein